MGILLNLLSKSCAIFFCINCIFTIDAGLGNKVCGPQKPCANLYIKAQKSKFIIRSYKGFDLKSSNTNLIQILP